MTDDIERLAREAGVPIIDDYYINHKEYIAALERFYRAAYRAGMENRPTVRPKPIDWTYECGRGAPGFQEWIDDRYGFHIRLSPDISAAPYIAAWGEGDSEEFATLEDAKQWCQQQIEAWVVENTELLEQPA